MYFKNLADTFNKQKKWLRISSYIMAGYLIYALMLGVLTPLVLHSQLPSVLSDKLGRTVTIEKISINPFLLRMRVSNFLIEEGQISEPFAHFDLLEVDAGFWQTLMHFTLSIEHIYIDAPYAHLARTSGGETNQFNVTDIINTLSQTSSEQTVADNVEQAQIPHIRLGKFRLKDGHVLLSDGVTGTDIDYPELAFELTELDTLAAIYIEPSDHSSQGAQNNYHFKLVTSEGGTLGVEGQFQLAPLEVKGHLELVGVALSPLWPLSDDVVEGKITSGLLNFQLDYLLSEESERIRFQADNGHLTLSELAIADSNKPRITIAGLNIRGLKLDTNTQQVDISEMSIDEPWLDANFDQNGVDLITMLTPKITSKTSATTSPPELSNTAPKVTDTTPSWRIVLQSFALNNGGIDLNESAISQGVKWRVFSINGTTGVVDTRFETPINYTLALGLAGDETQRPVSAAGSILSEGAVNVHRQQVSGTVDFTQFALKQLQPYVRSYANLILQEGEAALSGGFEAGAPSSLVFDGQASIHGLMVNDGLKQEPLVKWQNLQITGIQFNSNENALAVQKVELEKPYAKLVIDENKQTNIDSILLKPAADSAVAANDPSSGKNIQPAQSTPEPMAIRIEEVSVVDGSAYFADNSLRPRFASGIEALNGSITALSSRADSAANVDLNGKIDGYAPVALQGSLNPLIDDMFLDLNFSVSGAELTSVNPYSGTYMGHFIDKGLLSLDVKYTLENNQLTGDNHVIIDQLTLGKKTDSDQALSLPLGLAIALLQDSNGVIDLGLQVSGDLDNPSFGFASIVLQTLKNLIIKAVSAPFSLLANLVGSDDELNEITFAAGSFQLSDDMSQKLATLAGALAQRPGLRVNIEGTVNEVADAYELAEQKLQSQLRELTGQDSLPEKLSASTVPLAGPISEALGLLFTNTTNKTVDEERQLVKAKLQHGDVETIIAPDHLHQALLIAMYNQTRNAIKISPSALAKLADNRAKVVKTYLANVQDVEVNRLFLLNSRHHLQTDSSGVALTLEAN
ncbi:MAG: DUF748 domain-containing protein [Paraglaciecola polaris]|uniref:DUF748 domain-containing protein n=1 Tax=Paraglaciecola polaris TaxID=222814 RepID=UPI0030021BBC